jgi:hypothetical protein
MSRWGKWKVIYDRYFFAALSVATREHVTPSATAIVGGADGISLHGVFSGDSLSVEFRSQARKFPIRISDLPFTIDDLRGRGDGFDMRLAVQIENCK